LGGTTSNIQFQVTDSSAVPKTATKTLLLDIFGFSPETFLVPQLNVEFAPFSYIVASGGVEPIKWQVSGALPPGLIFQKNSAATDTRQYQLAGIPTQVGKYTFTITATDSGSAVRSQTRNYSVEVEPAKLSISASLLPVAVAGQSYSYQFKVSGGMPPFLFGLSPKNIGVLPAGLSFDTRTGILSGTPTAPGYIGFSVYVSDSSSPITQGTGWDFYWLLISDHALNGKNDSIANAVTLFPGTYIASISPLHDSSGNLVADEDYYKITSPAGATVFLNVSNQVFKPGTVYAQSLLDPVVEIVDANGHRLSTCNDPLDDNPPAGTPLPIDATPNGFDDQCMNWPGAGKEFGMQEDARLTFKVPGSTGNTTFYIHVFDWRGDARPDMFYTLSFSQQ
jgi:hypothetical protein